MIPVSIYIHIPFCVHRCAYCDFNTYAGMEKWIPAYIEALCREISVVSETAPEGIIVQTIFFGGGTPSYLSVSLLNKVLHTVRSRFQVMEKAEISLEANPGTVEPHLFEELREAGFNRLSIGMQSAIPKELKFLTRIHTVEDVQNSVIQARMAGFQNINLDLIFGIPGQTIQTWKNSLEFALSLQPEHVSLYSLTVEEGTPLNHWVEKGKISMPSDDDAAELYEYSMDAMAEAGYLQYEISNWAKQDLNGDWLMCRHNLQYWRYLPYLGFGAGAHGFFENTRISNVLGIPEYINRIKSLSSHQFPTSPAVDQILILDRQEQMKEFMMVGLRLTHEGVSLLEFYHRFGVSLIEVFGKEIEFLLARGLIEWFNENKRLRLTKRGKLLGNQVFLYFV